MKGVVVRSIAYTECDRQNVAPVGRLSLGLFVLVATGCAATGYQPIGYTGGFSETRLQENVFRINFSGNGYTSGERAANFALLRAAEITLKRGMHYFEILEYTGGTSTSFFMTHSQYATTAVPINKPSVSLTIACHKHRPHARAYEAKYLADSISQKYGLAVDTSKTPQRKKTVKMATKQTKAKVKAVLDSVAPKFDRCLSTGKTNGDLGEGTHDIVLNWIVLPDGKVEAPSAKVKGLTDSAQLILCINNILQHVRFPPSKHRLEVKDYAWRTIEVDPPPPSKCEMCATSCTAEAEACEAGDVAACYTLAACLCRCKLTAGGCGDDLQALAACIEENTKRDMRVETVEDTTPPPTSQPVTEQ